MSELTMTRRQLREQERRRTRRIVLWFGAGSVTWWMLVSMLIGVRQ